MSKLSQLEDFPEDDYYLSRMKEILEGYPKLGPLQHPSKLLEHLYIGNQDNADNLDLLQALEITHVLNCAGTRTFDLTRSPYRTETGIVGFLMMPAEDYEEFDIMQYFMDAIAFVDKAKICGGRALVHCNIGVNRSGAIVAAYLMVHLRRPLLQVVEDLKSKRSLILQNEGFRRQLVRFARCRGLLDVPERPPKKPTIRVNGYMNGNSESKAPAAATNQERSESVNNVANGTSTVADEATQEPQDVAAKGTSSNDHLSKDTPGEQSSEAPDEKKNSPPGNSGTGKNPGYENDLGNSADRRERLLNKLSFLGAPNADDKIDSRISYLDLGSTRPHLTKDDALLDFPSSKTLNSGNTRAIRDDPLSAKLSALSLELPQSRIHVPIALPYTYGIHRDHSSSFRVPSILQRISRESSISDISNSFYASLDDDVDLPGKYSTVVDKYRSSMTPVSSGYFEGDGSFSDHSPPSFNRKTFGTTPGIFISTVKPRSYYSKLVTPIALEDFDDDIGFPTIKTSSGRRSFANSRVFTGGNGMLFTPHMASPAYHKRNSVSYEFLYEPKSYVSSSRNAPYNRSSLSDIDSLSPYDFPQPRSSHAPYRPSSNYRSTIEYDNALDEYSDLLDASLGRSNTASAVAKSRARTGTGSGFRRAYKY